MGGLAGTSGERPRLARTIRGRIIMIITMRHPIRTPVLAPAPSPACSFHMLNPPIRTHVGRSASLTKNASFRTTPASPIVGSSSAPPVPSASTSGRANTETSLGLWTVSSRHGRLFSRKSIIKILKSTPKGTKGRRGLLTALRCSVPCRSRQARPRVRF